MKKKINFNIKNQIYDDIHTIEYLISLDPLSTIKDLYIQNAIFTKIMICLRDLIHKSMLYSKPIDFTDDVIITDKVKNVADLIKFIRDALCHIDSDNHKIKQCFLTYNVINGKQPQAMVLNDIAIGSDYEDDTCIIFGGQKIYYKRHILRAFEECKNNFRDIL